jgi:L-rhamnose mutarotase
MRSFAQALDLKDDPALIRRYLELHRRVWPEVVEALRAVGIHRMKIYLLGTRLFMYAEALDGFDPRRDYQAYLRNPRCREWDDLMRHMQQPAPGAPEGQWWATMQEVFDLEAADA